MDTPEKERAELTFSMGPFHKYLHNPVLGPTGDGFESKDVFNPAAIVYKSRIHLLYRAEDRTGGGQWNGVSRICHAVSDDGFHFERFAEPMNPHVLKMVEPSSKKMVLAKQFGVDEVIPPS